MTRLELKSRSLNSLRQPRTVISIFTKFTHDIHKPTTMPVRNRQANDPRRIKPLSTNNLHRAFYQVHTDLKKAGMLPTFDGAYATKISNLLDLPVAVPTKFLRNQCTVRMYGSPPSDATLNKMYIYSINPLNDYDFKVRFMDLCLRPTDDYDLLQMCQRANVPVEFYGLEEAEITRPERPGTLQFQKMRRTWMERDYFMYGHCLALSIEGEDAKLANAEAKKYASLCRRLQWENNYEE